MRKGLRRLGMAGLAVAIAATASAGSALGGASGARQTAEFTFTSQTPGASTGVSNTIDYFNPTNRNAKPFGVDRVILDPHPGTLLDTTVPAQCDEARAGADDCPAGSRVGGGVVRLDSGELPGSPLPRKLAFDVDLFNTLNGLLFRLEGRNNPLTLVQRARVQGDRLITDTPPVPGGPPDNQTAIDFVDLDIRAISNSRGDYITTPPTCPSSGRWTNRSIFSYNDDGDPAFEVTQTVNSPSPCRSASGGGGGGDGGRLIVGTSDDDVLVGTEGDDVIRCGAGSDRVNGRGGDDAIICGSGDDTVRAGSGDDRVYGESGDDELFGEEGDDLLNGAAGNDRLIGGPGTDELRGGAGADTGSQ